ncbi:hypothetical protein [Acinetobacter sp. Marseille-Q1618]|uniref:hypothetical protein n=1 Tax=Acinetobacter sp. Marseille-Q1618 TaxID=2697502 RepID=UPI00156EA727|nr:hypothetical protein [Acinetobacter sp. Marseille-Q1618]
MNKNSGLAKGTLVHTNKGLVPIQELKVGDMVLSLPENGEGDFVYQPVTEKFVSEDKEIWALFHQNCDATNWETDLKVVFVTGEYPIWVQEYDGIQVNGWMRPDELFEKSAVAIAKVSASGQLVKMYAQPVLETPYKDIGYLVSSWDHMPEFVIEFKDNKIQAYNVGHFFDGQGIESDIDESDSINKILIGHESLDVVQRFMTCFEQNKHGGFYDRYKTRVYNFTVDNYHTYFVEERGIWVHQ